MTIQTFYRQHKEKFGLFDGLFINNIVLERGLVLAPVIVVANTVRNALMIGIGFLLLTMSAMLLSRFIPKTAPYTIRVILYVLTACAMYVPVSLLLWLLFADNIMLVGIFLPLLVTNSLIVTKSETHFLKKKLLPMALDVFMHTLGFFLVIMVVGVLRELVGNATLLGQPVSFIPTKVSILMMPVGGFMIVGFLSAALQRFRGYLQATNTVPHHARLYELRKDVGQ